MDKVLFWFRRDLRLNDNKGLYHALSSGLPVLPVFVFDSNLLEGLPEDDRRVNFLFQNVLKLEGQLKAHGSGLLVRYGDPMEIIQRLIAEYQVRAIFANADYEPYSLKRDLLVRHICQESSVEFRTFDDHVIFNPNEILKSDGKPYTVFTPYSRAWNRKLISDPVTHYPSEKIGNYCQINDNGGIPDPAGFGFTIREMQFPSETINHELIRNYHNTRDYPALEGTSRLGIHLRFGTISIRELAEAAVKRNSVFLNELVWREFYQMILYHFPHVVTRSFDPVFERLPWINKDDEFEAWCEGRTGYPMVDAGMRELVATGYMHNRVRMLTAGFLTRHLLIDWRWGEAFFARHLLDYELASNNGGWQWSAGTGCDAVPYFRIFNPGRQMERFDPEGEYVLRWVPEAFGTASYPSPIVDHDFARRRALEVFRNTRQKGSV